MRIIVVMDSFKGSLSSADANQAVENGVKQIFSDADVKAFAIADGGEGTAETLVDGMNGSTVEISVTGPLGTPVQASYGLIKDENLAIIEAASACGLTLLSEAELNPLITTTYGVGELINHAYDNGARKFIIGLGGGAAGGLGAALHGYLNGQLESGVELIMDVLGVEEELKTADLVITGEGRIDAQTSMGKVPAGMASLAGKYSIQVIAVGGSLTEDAYHLNHYGINAVFSIQTEPLSIEEAMDSKRTRTNIEKTVEQIMRTLKISL